MTPATRDKFATRKFRLLGVDQVRAAITSISNAPLDTIRPLEILIREEVKARGLDANARMWVGPLKDIAEQAWMSGRRFPADVWHYHFKKQFLPEAFDPELTKEGYRKWDYAPSGDPVLVGSTTDLTVKGFALYLTELEAFGANLGVEYSASPNEGAPR